MRRSLRHAAMPLFMVLCLILGGSTRAAWANMILQLLAIAIIAWAALSRPRMQLSKSASWLIWLVGLMIAIVALQLVPLPPALWRLLPGRDVVVNGYALLGQPLPWLPLSLAPAQTMSSALWLLPPVALLAGTLRLGAYKASWFAFALVATTFVSVLLGALQVTRGGWAYFHEITNVGVATGFFANANHMATLLLVTVPFLIALLGARKARSKSLQSSVSKVAIVAGGLMVILLGLALNGSLAGWGLAVPVVAASLLIRSPLADRRARWALAGAGMLGIAAAALVLSSPLQNNLTSAGADQSVESRRTTFARSLTAAADFAPFGSGIGSFELLYPSYEDPGAVGLTYVNHVHSDYIEIALETGLAGVVLTVLFLLWWGARTTAIWRDETIDFQARAATIASAAMLAHSLVDYPLRTSGLAAMFAICLALMIAPRPRLRVKPLEGDQQAKHLSIG
ncbi:MAG: O-antigen ligase family protein [Pseudomonadota bacterium]|nr:O-antigen ligase family protein [Pseudomonadota bacterium]